MHRSPAELKEFVANAVVLSNGTMALTLVARDLEEFDWLTIQMKKTKKLAQIIGVRLDTSVLQSRGVGKGRV